MALSRRMLAAIALVIILVACAWWWRTSTESDEVKIQRVIETGRNAIEDKSLRGVMELLAHDYHDNLGLNEQSVRPMLQRLFFAVPGLHIDVKSQSHPVFNGSGSHRTATVTLSVVVSGSVQGQPSYLMGAPSEPADATVTLTQDDRKWLISEVSGLIRPQLE
jgi:ribosomal protein L31